MPSETAVTRRSVLGALGGAAGLLTCALLQPPQALARSVEMEARPRPAATPTADTGASIIGVL